MTHHYSSAEQQRLISAAMARAHQLRGEAIADFCHETGDTARRALRSANRLAHSLAHHTWLRKQQET